VLPSDNPKNKLEVYDKNGIFITYAGGAGYKDFPTYIAEKGQEYANNTHRNSQDALKTKLSFFFLIFK
jgi:hypothetical protein